MRDRLSLRPGSSLIALHRRDEQLDPGSEDGKNAEVKLGLSESAGLEIQDCQETRPVKIPELVVGMQVAMDENGASWEGELVIDPVAPAAHH